MKKRIFSLVLAAVMFLTFTPSVFAAPETSVKVGAGIDTQLGDTQFDHENPTTIITGPANQFETAKVNFEVVLSTAEIRQSIIDWYEYGRDLLLDFMDPETSEEEAKVMADFNKRIVTGNFTVTIALSNPKVTIPEKYLTVPMAGFNDEANIVFAEKSRSYEKDTLTIELKIKDGMRADELYAIATAPDNEKKGLSELVFTAEGIDADAMDVGTCYVDGKLTGQTVFYGNSKPYPVSFYTSTVRSTLVSYKTHRVDGDVKVNGYKDGNVVKIKFINYVSRETVDAHVGAPTGNGAGFKMFHYTLPEMARIKSGTYNIVIEVFESDSSDKAIATLTKIVTMTDEDGDIAVSEAHLNIHREQNSSSSNKKDETSYHPHDKFETKADDSNETHKKDKENNNTAITPPVAGESDSANHNHEADEAVEDIKADYNTNTEKYEEKKNEVIKEAIDSGIIGGETVTPENETNIVVKEEIHSDRWVEGVYHENFVGVPESDLYDTQKEVASSQNAIAEEIKNDENIKEPGDEEDIDPEEGNIIEKYVEPTYVFFEFSAWASDRIDYILQLTDKDGNLIGAPETKYVYIDENNEFKKDPQPRQVEETETVYEIVVNLDELAKSEKELYELYVSGKSIFVHREHEGDVQKFKMLSKGQYENKKFVDATYYVDEEKSQIHIFTQKFSEYAVTLADGIVDYYEESSGIVVSKKYTITFNIDGVTTEVAPLTVTKTLVNASTLPVPTKEGYIFDGWYIDSAMTEKANGQIKVANKMVLYGHWKSELLDTENHFAYVIGYEDGTVRAENNITRAEVAMIFYRLLRDDVREEYFATTNDFSDVKSGDWYNNAVSTMANGGFIEGYPDGTFAPNKKITRAEFATMATRFASLNDMSGKVFTDLDGHWSKDYVLKAATAGWIEGYPDGTFLPEKDITRAEAMTIINRVLMRSVNKEGLHADATLWIDMKGDEWYYYIVLEATNSHDYARQADGINENWTEIVPNKTWD